MGVWERSPASAAIANQNQALVDDFRRALPDFRPDDNGSAYSVRATRWTNTWVAQKALPLPKGAGEARFAAGPGFRPNHVAPDHPWAIEHPEYFIQGNADDARNDPTSYIEVQGKVYACGRDPYFRHGTTCSN